MDYQFRNSSLIPQPYHGNKLALTPSLPSSYPNVNHARNAGVHLVGKKNVAVLFRFHDVESGRRRAEHAGTRKVMAASPGFTEEK